ncbi:PHD finger protein 20-like protein 1 isoform X2 [Bufo bufo]|uniref:PHD finger protein 20-like protein 1 isoform X2 n=1 Tax=Bufo bufo TaxID=8384 RepID=UPI001ABDE941|nr:PHD finger protein 20-like protein 1 isoform X2 [Bufo bufo]
MSKKPPVRPGITFEVGARLEAQDYLQKWYPSKIEKMDYEEGKMLVHFERWSSRYDEWIHWDSTRIRPLERPALRKEGLRDDEEDVDFNEGEEVLARWTDCRYYPAKIEAINKEGTYTVQFYDGVIRCLKKMHIKSMPEDARGQDWIALVKAAAVLVKSKSSNKPRTSVNSNKDTKEEKKMHKLSLKKEDVPIGKAVELFHKEEEPTSSRTLEIALEEVPKLPLQSREDEVLLKRKISQASTFQAKRARLNKITGLLASKAVVLDDAEKKQQATEQPAKQEEAITPKHQSQIEADICHSSTAAKPLLLPPSLSSGKSRSKKDKQESVEASGCKKSPSLSITDPLLNQGTPHNSNLSRPSGRNNQRRRSRRLTSETSGDVLRMPFSEGQSLLSYTETPQDLSIPKVPDVAFVPQETLEPLDLSRNVEIKTPIIPESTYHCPTKEKEPLQMITYSPKAIADGRIASTSSALESHALSLHTTLALPNNLKPPKGSKKKKSSGVLSTEMTVTLSATAAENKPPDRLQEKIMKKVNDKDKQPDIGVVKSEKKIKSEDKTSSAGKKKEKDKERKEKKEKDHSKSKQKKKKKKKKKKHSDYEEGSLEFLDRSSSPVIRSSSSVTAPNNTLAVKDSTFQFPCAILSVDLTGENLSEMEFLEDSSTESLILSGDEYNQEFDSTNFEESQDEEEGVGEIVRCVCEMDEENGFMIQCEECLCWQHSICMGLLEDSIPEQYICYVCSDPPGQRWSAKYKYDRDWFNNGRMCGLSFINENYSYLNAKKIVSTHHLLADVYGVTEILHGLQLKFGILQNTDHPDLRLWSRPVKPREGSKGKGGKNPRGPTNKLDATEETYIANEHCYQKPHVSGGENKTPNDTGKSGDNNRVIVDGHKSSIYTEEKRRLSDHISVERRTEQVPRAEDTGVFQFSIVSLENQVVSTDVCNDRRAAEEQLDAHLQWQLNLLTHIESVQNEVTSRMDLIEKEVDVLESWLDFTGELEPPDPLTRLPQLKRRMKQLLIDMGKVQQIATLCSV